jgi:hypothetical protein
MLSFYRLIGFSSGILTYVEVFFCSAGALRQTALILDSESGFVGLEIKASTHFRT